MLLSKVASRPRLCRFLLTVLCGLSMLTLAYYWSTDIKMGTNYMRLDRLLLDHMTTLTRKGDSPLYADRAIKAATTLQSVEVSTTAREVAEDEEPNDESLLKISELEAATPYRDLLESIVKKSPYLVPINRGVYDVIMKDADLRERLTLLGKTPEMAVEDVIRYGLGLEPYTTEHGEEAWMENGVIHRPPRPPEIEVKYPSPHSPDVEEYIPFDHERFFEGKPHPPVNQSESKIILWWIPTRYWPPTSGLSRLRVCPEFPCVITTNRSYMKQSSALIATGDRISQRPPSNRRPDQIFIFSNHEPEGNWFKNKELNRPNTPWKNVFNWTMTYHFNSDVTSLYGISRRRRVPIVKNYDAIFANKTKMVAWIVSNCNTVGQRHRYVKELKKYIPVDVYGACGKLKCPRANDDECFQMVNTTYKFYLSFESNLCTDYISEKVFRYLAANTITVARASNEFYRHAPSDIFLNTADYPSPKALAERMLYLANNKEEYINLLIEKDKYMFPYEDYPIRLKSGQIRYMHYHYEAVAFCEVCQRLWNLDKYNGTIPDISQWVRAQYEECKTPTDLDF